MSGYAPSTSRLAVPARRGFALVAGPAVVAVLVYADLLAADQDIVIGTVVVGPLLCSVWGRPRDAALVGAVATACAILSTAWNENIAEATYVLRAAVVAIGSVLAVPGHGAGSRVRSTVEVPLVARGRTLGALTMTITADSGRTYDAEDARFAEVLAGRVAVALDP